MSESKEQATLNDDAIEKLKTRRSRLAGWLTRAVTPLDEDNVSQSPAVLHAMQERITSQLRKLQSCHDTYVDALNEPDDIDEAEDWMQKYFDMASAGLEKVETLLKTRLKVQISSANVLEVSTAPVNHLPASSVVQAPGSTASQSIPEVPVSDASMIGVATSAESVSTVSTATVSVSATSPPMMSTVSTPNSASVFEVGDLASASPPTMKKSLDAWIDELVPGMETKLSTSSNASNLTEAIARLEVERDLPKVELPTFDGSALMWPPFIEQFYIQVHTRAGLTDCRRMDLLQSHVKGEAKRLIQGLGYSGVNYAQSLKELKFVFGHRVNVARAYVNAITSGNIVPSGDAIALRSFYVSVRDCITTLNQMSYTGELHSSDVIQRAIKRIPSDKRVRWNDFIRKICRTREPSLMDLQSWLKDCVESEFSPYAITSCPPKQRTVTMSTAPSSSYATINVTTGDQSGTRKCQICSGEHHISKCKDYCDKSPEERYSLVKSKRLCFNCLNSSHQIANCTSTVVCKVPKCTRKHHTSLHRSRNSADHVSHVNNIHIKKSIYFQVLPVIVQGRNGCCRNTYAMLDSASDVSMIDTDLAKDLGLRGNLKTLNVRTVNSTVAMKSMTVSLSLRECNNPDARPVWIQEAWTRHGNFNCPQFQASDIQHMTHLQDLQLQDIDPREVKILIGANVPKAHLQLCSREGQANEPVAIRTALGWCILGPSLHDSAVTDANVNFTTASDDMLSTQIEQFWQTEAFGVSANLQKPRSMEDMGASKVLDSETKFINGHYEVPMLWKESFHKMPDDRTLAERRFKSLEKRLRSDAELQEKYSAVLNGYIAKGHARKLTAEEVANTSNKTWYLPHHCILHPKKPNKVRVVFDAAAEFEDVSLNKCLITGPDLLNNIFGVLQRFRLKPIAVVADVMDMFHQVRVSEEDSDALRFLWKQNLDDCGKPDTFKMLVHIFGATDSPCCANYALQSVAKTTKEGDVKQVILRNFYMDDMLMAADDVTSAVEIASKVTQCLSQKGFVLTKWMSSSAKVMQHFSQEKMPSQLNLDFNNLPLERVLGIGWNLQTDSFIFNPVVKTVLPTKRNIVSAVSSIYDPCGFLAPFAFKAKLLIQELWLRNLDWDDPLHEDLLTRWQEWQDDLQHLQQLSIPRYFNFPPGQLSLELHLFSDASEAGFASVAYLRAASEHNVISCVFLAAKTHVAPMKQVLTIPKLELQGAVMSVRLADTLQSELDVSVQVWFWTDSVTVLRYVCSETRRWKIFVANRVTEIRESSQPNQWKYVPSEKNPADLASRGSSAECLISTDCWFHGPEFLWKNKADWPSFPVLGSVPHDDENLKRVNTVSTLPTDVLSCNHLDISTVVDVEHFSDWYSLKRRAAWILRAIRNFLSFLPGSKRKATKSTYLQCQEIHEAEMHLIRMSQRECFSKEISRLKAGEDLDSRSHLRPLDPILDPMEDVIRVGGRLRNAPELVGEVHPILLPFNHQVTKLILHDIHCSGAHCGPEQMIASVRLKFWPIKCRQMAKGVIHRCWDCRRRSVKPVTPYMADLPQQRTQAFSRPFQFTGVDYFGPMLVKRVRARVKVWGCIFTCLVTRAIHLELSSSLEADDFIMTLRCFIGRRGAPKEMFSDNGTNFRGAENELRDALSSLNQEKVQEFLLQQAVDWHFIPPNAPHFGGAWERLVRSVKAALKAVLKEQFVTESVLRTTLIEVESIINSRPITYNSSDPNDYMALTPNHFLLGGSMPNTSIVDIHPSDIDSRKRWRQVQVLTDHLWHRWLSEYLPSLSVRGKWTDKQRNLLVNDLVLIVDDHLPRGQWPLARVVEVQPSKDGQVRKLTVRTSRGIYARPAHKVCLLEEAQLH
jgi:hypothetical protein